MKYLFIGLLVLFPLVSSAATLTSQQVSNLETELQTLETELDTYLSSTCTTGKSWQNGSCQWTASSTAAIDAIQEQAQAEAQEQAQTAQQDLQNRINADQQEYAEYQTDIQNLESKVQRVCSLTTLGNPPVPTGLAAASAQEDGEDCSDISAETTPEVQADEQQESNLQTQIDEDNSELDS